jgi:hypothetical protein
MLRVRILLDLVRVRVSNLFILIGMTCLIEEVFLLLDMIEFDVCWLLSLFLNGKNHECTSCRQGLIFERQCQLC